ncbi:unnamed protein product, partial [Iphiclides podalirius]
MRSAGCQTFTGQYGTCSRLDSCPALIEKLKGPVFFTNVAYIQKLRCQGYDQYSVCCVSPSTPFWDIDPRRHTATETSREECTPSELPPDPEGGCCGYQSADDDRIVGGFATSIDQYPWLVLIEYEMTNTGSIELACGGSLISSRYVLTAGHCVKGTVLDKATPVSVRLGEYDISNPGPDCVETPGGGEDCTAGPTSVAIEEIIPHDSYDANDRNRKHDIALVRLNETAPYTDFIRPICLPTSDLTLEPPSDLRLYTSGWGFVENKFGIRSNIKLEVDLPLEPRSTCRELFSAVDITISEEQICAGGERGKDACKGDSGGPLMDRDERRYRVIGVVSFGPKPCGQENRPSVYTNVYKYLPWIRSQMRA